jgi:hypothetical protein
MLTLEAWAGTVEDANEFIRILNGDLICPLCGRTFRIWYTLRDDGDHWWTAGCSNPLCIFTEYWGTPDEAYDMFIEQASDEP